jgi:hypothetical protein
MLDCLITPKNIAPDSPKEFYEVYFVYACIWAIGGTLYRDQVCIKIVLTGRKKKIRFYFLLVDRL